MRFVELAPDPRLRRYVQLLWCLELDAVEELGAAERIAPDGIVELVFHYREPMAVRYAGERFAPQPRSSLVSQTRRWLEIVPRGATGLVSVRFRPWGAQHFLPVPVSELADRVIPAAELWGAEVFELEERLALASSGRERVALVEGFLLRRLRPRDDDLESLIRTVWQRREDLRVGELCREVGVGERRLQRLFSSALGMTPKSYIRLSRFLGACSILRRGRFETLTGVAHVSGYYDQSHFIADFKALAGMTPGEFLEHPSLSFLELG